MLTLLFLLLLFSLLLPIVVAVLVVPGDAVFCTLQSIEDDKDDKDCVLGAFNGELAKEMFFSGMTMVLAGVVFSVAEDITPFIFSC